MSKLSATQMIDARLESTESTAATMWVCFQKASRLSNCLHAVRSQSRGSFCVQRCRRTGSNRERRRKRTRGRKKRRRRALSVDRTAGAEPPCLAGSGEIPLRTNHTLFLLILPFFCCLSSSSSSSLQVAVAQARFSWGALTAPINKRAGSPQRVHTHTHTLQCTKKHTPFLFLHSLLLNPRACSCTGATHTGLL